MARNAKPAPTMGRAGCDKHGGASHPPFTLATYRIQQLTAHYAVSPELAAALAIIAFGGGHG